MLRINKTLCINPAFIVAVEVQDEAVVIETTTRVHVAKYGSKANVMVVDKLLSFGRYDSSIETVLTDDEFADLVLEVRKL